MEDGKLRSADIARFIMSMPYSFRGAGNKRGGRPGNVGFDMELFPWPFMRLESDWTFLTRPEATDQTRWPTWNTDLVLVGGQGHVKADQAPEIQAPNVQLFQPGPPSGLGLLSAGQWYLGLGHRYFSNDKTETVLQFDFGLGKKWQITTFHRYTWKEVAGPFKRFDNLREYQYGLKRDLHDWVAQFVWRVDREHGEEIFFTMTLKAFPQMPIEMEDSYHQPKLGSQSSPFSPIAGLGE